MPTYWIRKSRLQPRVSRLSKGIERSKELACTERQRGMQQSGGALTADTPTAQEQVPSV